MNLEFLTISSGRREESGNICRKNSDPEADQDDTATSITQPVAAYQEKLIEELMRKYVLDNLSEEEKSCEDLILNLSKKREEL